MSEQAYDELIRRVKDYSLLNSCAPVIGRLLGEVEGSALVRDRDSVPAVNVREIRRTYDRAVKLPKELVEELARVTTRAQQIWQEAREANDFKAFRPWLEKIVHLKRQE